MTVVAVVVVFTRSIDYVVRVNRWILKGKSLHHIILCLWIYEDFCFSILLLLRLMAGLERLHQNVLDKNGTFWLTFYLFLRGLLNVTCSPLFVRCEQHLQPSVIFNLNSFYWLVLLEFPMLCITFISWPGEKSWGWQKSQGPQSFMSWSLIWNPRDTEVLWTISETKVTTKPEPSWTIVCN